MQMLVAILTFSTATSFSSVVYAAPYTFHYSSGATITVEAASYEVAYKNAATACFRLLTGGLYPGEEQGLQIIDICANPLNFKTTRSSK